MRRTSVLIGLLLALAAGCVAVPFQETELVPVEREEPGAVLERFRAGMPDNFQLLSTVVFEYNSRTFSGIGSVRINAADGVFTVACMNPMGVKLFEFSGDRNRTETLYAIADFSRYGDLASAVGDDIRRIYFDLVPGPGATLWRKKNKLVFRQAFGQGTLEHIFGGRNGDLLEKNYFERDGIVWKASYYEYQDQNGKRWPKGIVFIHYNHGYRLTVRQKELSV